MEALRPAVRAGAPEGKLCDRMSPPLRICDRRKPHRLLRTPKDEWVLDFGQMCIRDSSPHMHRYIHSTTEP